MKTIFVIIASILLLSQNIDAQICDSLSVNDSLSKLNLSKTLIPDSAKHTRTDKYHFRSRQLILPTILVGTGIMGLTSDWMEYQNHEMKDELRENIDKKITIDDFSQYAPFISVYALDLCGVKGEHNLRDYTAILATSYLLMGVTVNALKMCIREQRPDNSSFNSFPSGHTATAFMGAELLRHEFRHISPWIGVAGYAVAAGTGFFRMYNNRHWFTDILAGAGIGILSAKASYWLFPYISKKLFKKKRNNSIDVIQTY
jgi:hypothetical protein